MNLSKAKDQELIAELKRRRILSDRAVSAIVNRMFGLDASERQAEHWLQRHNHIFLRMEEMALGMLRDGKKASSRLLVEKLRSEDDSIRIPNAVSKHLNKLMIEHHPELRALFRRCSQVL